MSAETEIITADSSTGLLKRNIEGVRKSQQAIRKHDPDVLLLDCYESLGFLVTLLCLWYNIPMVCRLVGDNWRVIGEEGMEKAKQKGIIRILIRYIRLYLNEFIYRRAIGFIVVSNELREVVASRTECPLERIEVVHVPAPFNQQGSAERAKITHGIKERMVVLTVTNLTYRKKYEGVKTIVTQIHELLAKNNGLAYVVAGGGFYYPALLNCLNESITKPSLRDRIYALEEVDDICDLYDLADIFVYISYLDGYPNVILEAQKAALPVVANAAHGMVEQIDHGKTGLLIDTPSQNDLAEKMQFLINNPDERVRLGRNARKKVLQENSPDVIGHRLEEALQRILENQNLGAS